MARLKTKGVSKSDIVRQYLGRHPKASVSEIVTALKPYKVSESVAAKIKYDEFRQGATTTKKKPGQKAAASTNGSTGTKADAIREVAGGMEKPIRPVDVVAALKAKGIEVLYTHVSQVLASMGMKKKRRRRRKAAALASVSSASLNINDLVAAKKLVGEVGSIAKVKEALAALARLS